MESLWNELMDNLEEIGGIKHMTVEPEIKQETQIEQLLDMAILDFKVAIVEYKKRVDAGLLHAKARIAQLETDKATLRSMIVELRKEIEQIREIVKEKKSTQGYKT